jgi:hypothetical protein
MYHDIQELETLHMYPEDHSTDTIRFNTHDLQSLYASVPRDVPVHTLSRTVHVEHPVEGQVALVDDSDPLLEVRDP